MKHLPWKAGSRGKRTGSTRSPEKGARGKTHSPGAVDDLRSWMHQGLYDLPPEAAVLAIGCEEAFSASHLTEYSSDVTVLDSSPGQVAQLARRFPEIAFLPHAPANPLPFAHDTFDAIWCCEFLDRVFDPIAALREMHRVLKPDGRLLIAVPDHGTVRNVISSLLALDPRGAGAQPRMRCFTRKSLAALVGDANFGSVTLARRGGVRRLVVARRPRNLLLRARKLPLAKAVPAAGGVHADVTQPARTEALPFAGRARAA